MMGKAVVNSTVQAIPFRIVCLEHAKTDWCLGYASVRPMMASGERHALQAGHMGATDRIFTDVDQRFTKERH